MNCPKCNNVDLKVKIKENLSSCPVCGGMWLEKDGQEIIRDIYNFETGGHKKPDHDSKTGLCPQGHGILIRAKVEIEPNFYLEKCPKCNGIWFDKGEWQKIAEYKIEDNLLNLWSTAWQKQLRNKKREEEIEKQNIEALGEYLYKKIKELANEINEHPERYKALLLFNEEIEKFSLTRR